MLSSRFVDMFRQVVNRGLTGSFIAFSLNICFFSTIVDAQTVGDAIDKFKIQYLTDQRIDENRLNGYTSIKQGDKLSMGQLDRDAQALYQSGLVDSVKFLWEETQLGKGTLILEIRVRPVFLRFNLIGGDIYNQRYLKRWVNFKVGDAMPDEKLAEIKRQLIKSLRKKAYPEVKVDYAIRPSEKLGFGVLDFSIQKGRRAWLKEVLFKGNHIFSNEQLIKKMSLRKKGIGSFLTGSGVFDEQKLDQSLKRIIESYQGKGYLNVKIKAKNKVFDQKQGISLVISIDEGKKYVVSSLEIIGDDVYSSQELEQVVSLKVRESYSANKVRRDRQKIAELYGEQGYSDIKVLVTSQEIGNNEIKVIYKIDKGKVSRLGLIDVYGAQWTKDKVIRRELPFIPGQPLSSTDLDIARRRLLNLRYFDYVNVDVKPSKEGDIYRDIEIRVKERTTRSLTAGAAFSSIENIVGTIDLSYSNFDFNNPWNFLGGGQRFGLSLQTGTNSNFYRLFFTEPWFLDRKLSLGFELSERTIGFNSSLYDQQVNQASTSLRFPLGGHSEMSLRYRIQNIDLDYDDVVFRLDENPYSKEEEYLDSQWGINYLFDSRDRSFFPTSGNRFSFNTEVSSDLFGGELNTVTWDIDYSSLFKMSGDVRWLFRFNAVTVDGFSKSDEVPVFKRQFLGGSRDIRGFDFYDIGGERNKDLNEVTGGKTKAFASIEMSVSLVSAIRAAVFFDAGFVNEDSYEFKADDHYSSFGVGIRFNTPNFPISLDWGVPVRSPDKRADKGTQFNFYVSHQF